MKCYICYSKKNLDICEICDKPYCENCSYIFKNQFSPMGNYCYKCIDQFKYTESELTYLKRKHILDDLQIH